MSLSRCRHDLSVAERLSVDLDEAFADACDDVGRAFPSGPTISVALFEVADWLPWLPDALTILSTSEGERVRRRRITGDREALALAYALHRLLLARVLACKPSEVPLTRDELGCPRVAGDGIRTSLSHADGLMAMAVTASGPVGVDIEPATRVTDMQEIARRVYHYSEATRLYVASESVRSAALLAMWVRKEAVLKAAGIGLAVPMENFAAPEHAALRLPGLCAQPIQVRMLEAGDRCVAAVAGPVDTEIECRWVMPRLHARPRERRCGSGQEFGPIPMAFADAS